MNSYNTDIFFSNYYNLQSVHFELQSLWANYWIGWDAHRHSSSLIKLIKWSEKLQWNHETLRIASFNTTSLQLLYLRVHKLTFYSLKLDKKNALDLYMGQKTEITKSSGHIFCVTIVYLKENSRIKGKFFKKILTQKIRKTYFLPPK